MKIQTADKAAGLRVSNGASGWGRGQAGGGVSPNRLSGPPRAQCGVHGFAAPPCPPCPVAVQGEPSRSQLSTPRPRLQKRLFLSSTPEWVALGTRVPDLWMATVPPPRTPLSVLGQIKSLTSIKSSCSHCAQAWPSRARAAEERSRTRAPDGLGGRELARGKGFPLTPPGARLRSQRRGAAGRGR